MRVAIVTTSYPAFEGDACGHFVETEAARMAARDEVVVVTARHGHAGVAHVAHAEAPITARQVSVERLDGGDAFGWPGLASRIQSRPARAFALAAWLGRARATLARLRPDRVVAHWAVPCGWPASRGLGVPLELVSHGADVRALAACPRPVRRALVGALLRDADAWRFVSTSLADRLLEALDADQARRVGRILRVEACPIDVPDVRALADELRALHAGAHLAVCVGRLVAGKRVDRVIDHASRLGDRCRLVVVGDGPLGAELERRARAKGLDARFVGRTPRPVALAWMAAADVVLHASEEEGLSTVEREAASLGVPFRRLAPGGGVHADDEMR